jgi:HAD superfamily hydrolase (TIGR01509 family)
MSAPAIIFDCDGVLVDSEAIYVEVERKHLAELGLKHDTIEYQTRFVGLLYEDYIAELAAEYEALGKGEFPVGLADRIKSESKTRIAAELQPIVGIEPLLDQLLDQLDKNVAVASSSSVSALHWKLELTGLHQHFAPHIYSGEQVERGKPAPDLFLLAASHLETAPEDCIVVEDSVNGVRAGVAAGMTVWGFTGGGHADAGLHDRLMNAGANNVFSSFANMGDAYFSSR